MIRLQQSDADRKRWFMTLASVMISLAIIQLTERIISRAVQENYLPQDHIETGISPLDSFLVYVFSSSMFDILLYVFSATNIGFLSILSARESSIYIETGNLKGIGFLLQVSAIASILFGALCCMIVLSARRALLATVVGPSVSDTVGQLFYFVLRASFFPIELMDASLFGCLLGMMRVWEVVSITIFRGVLHLVLDIVLSFYTSNSLLGLGIASVISSGVQFVLFLAIICPKKFREKYGVFDFSYLRLQLDLLRRGVEATTTRSKRVPRRKPGALNKSGLTTINSDLEDTLLDNGATNEATAARVDDEGVSSTSTARWQTPRTAHEGFHEEIALADEDQEEDDSTSEMKFLGIVNMLPESVGSDGLRSKPIDKTQRTELGYLLWAAGLLFSRNCVYMACQIGVWIMVARIGSEESAANATIVSYSTMFTNIGSYLGLVVCVLGGRYVKTICFREFHRMAKRMFVYILLAVIVSFFVFFGLNLEETSGNLGDQSTLTANNLWPILFSWIPIHMLLNLYESLLVAFEKFRLPLYINLVSRICVWLPVVLYGFIGKHQVFIVLAAEVLASFLSLIVIASFYHLRLLPRLRRWALEEAKKDIALQIDFKCIR